MIKVNHSHCPNNCCDHPQPFICGCRNCLIEYCGRCWVQDGLLVIMIPCTPDICKDKI